MRNFKNLTEFSEYRNQVASNLKWPLDKLQSPMVTTGDGLVRLSCQQSFDHNSGTNSFEVLPEDSWGFAFICPEAVLYRELFFDGDDSVSTFGNLFNYVPIALLDSFFKKHGGLVLPKNFKLYNTQTWKSVKLEG